MFADVELDSVAGTVVRPQQDVERHLGLNNLSAITICTLIRRMGLVVSMIIPQKGAVRLS